jgi:hypothetical protein
VSFLHFPLCLVVMLIMSTSVISFIISSLLIPSAVIFVKPFSSIELVEKLSINKLLVYAILVELSFLVLTRMLMVGL